MKNLLFKKNYTVISSKSTDIQKRNVSKLIKLTFVENANYFRRKNNKMKKPGCTV